MSSKAHVIAVKEPIYTWPTEITALCGAVVKDPRPVMSLSPDGRMESKSTIYFCRDCGKGIIKIASGERRYLYGVMTAEEAFRINLLNRMED